MGWNLNLRLMICTVIAFLAALISSAVAEECLSSQQVSEGRSWTTRESLAGACPIYVPELASCFDRLRKFKIYNKCSRSQPARVTAGIRQERIFLGALSAKDYECLEVRDQCKTISVKPIEGSNLSQGSWDRLDAQRRKERRGGERQLLDESKSFATGQMLARRSYVREDRKLIEAQEAEKARLKEEQRAREAAIKADEEERERIAKEKTKIKRQREKVRRQLLEEQEQGTVSQDLDIPAYVPAEPCSNYAWYNECMSWNENPQYCYETIIVDVGQCTP